jgi:hypothetical protein
MTIMKASSGFKIVNMVSGEVYTHKSDVPWEFASIEAAQAHIAAHNPWVAGPGLVPYGAAAIPADADFPEPELIQPGEDLAETMRTLGFPEVAEMMSKQSIANKEEALSLLLKDLAERYRTSKVAGSGSAGREWYGLANILADYDMSVSPGSGAWLKNLEAAIEVGFAKYVDRYSAAMVQVAKLLCLDKGRCCSDDAYTFNNIRAYAVVIAHPQERIHFWYCLPSVPEWYLIRLERSPELDAERWKYVARSVSERQWEEGVARPEMFKYGDSRDPGYCGNLETSLARRITDGFAFAVAFRKCFDPLSFQIEAFAEELATDRVSN